MKKFVFLFIFSTLLWSCARVGSPVGGKKDTLAPRFLHASIDSTRVKIPVTTKELRLDFDKYIVLKDINKNLTITPPIKSIKKILPSNLANKYILIQWEDTLKANTTYNFNFGNAIRDNNEGNTLSYYNFAFSTGDHLDELYISGVVKDGLKIKETKDPKPLVVGLYPDSDSIDYKQKPYYITKADDDGYYELNYLSPGKYRIIAFEDENANSIYEPGKEKIGFLKSPVVVEKSISGLDLSVYPSVKPIKFKEAKSVVGGVLFLFEGNPNTVKIESLSDKLKDYHLSHKSRSDSAMVWLDANKQNIGVEGPESLKFSYQIDELPKKETSITYRKSTKDELTLNSEESLLAPGETFKVNANYAIQQILPNQWSLKVDSTQTQPFTAEISKFNPHQIEIKSDFKSGKKYQIIIPKETVQSYYKSNSKSYLWDISADGIENYGRLKINLSSVPNAPFWLKLYNSSDDLAYSQKSTNSEVTFENVKPGTYYLKIFVDENNNGYWDEANFEKQQFAEMAKVYYKPVLAKALWDVVENWDLNDSRTIDTSVNTIPVEQPSTKNTTITPKQPQSKTPERKEGNLLKLKN